MPSEMRLTHCSNNFVVLFLPRLDRSQNCQEKSKKSQAFESCTYILGNADKRKSANQLMYSHILIEEMSALSELLLIPEK